MRFCMALVVIVAVVAAGMVMASCTSKASPLAEDAQSTDGNANQVAGAPQGNVSQPAGRSVPQAVPVTPSDRVLPVSPATTTGSTATNITSNSGQIASTATVVPQPMNMSTASNTSAGMIVPRPVIAPENTNVSSATLAPQFKRPIKGISFSRNAPRSTNISTFPSAPMHPGSATNYAQSRRVPQSTGTQQAACRQDNDSTQQSPQTAEAVAELIKSLDMLTGMYTKFPSRFAFLEDAEKEAPQGNTGALQNPLEKFHMCTLITRVGDERGPITLVVAAEDEERMRAPKSYYQVGNSFPEKQRAFTSYCPGRDDLYLTFKPSRKQ